MAGTQQIPRRYEDAVAELVRQQAEGGAPDLRVFAFADPSGRIIRLLHVSEAFPTLGAVRIYRFGESEEVPFRVAIAFATPEQWERVRFGALALGEGWDMARARQVWP